MDIFGSASSSQNFIQVAASAVSQTGLHGWQFVALGIGVPLFFWIAQEVIFIFGAYISERRYETSWWYATVDHLTYYPFKDSHRGYWYRLPSWAQKEWLP